MIALLAACVPVPDPDPPQTAYAREQIVVMDGTRDTPDLGGQEGHPGREIEVVVWSGPHETPASRPLILVAHGADGHPEKFEGLAAALVDAGFVVAAPAFPSTNRDNEAGYAGLVDLVNQPGDLDVVVDVLTASADDPTDGLHHRFDPQELGVIGHSLGSVTVLGWARHACCRSDRVQAVVHVSTPQSLAVAFGSSRVDPVGPPTILVHGEEDGTVPIVESETLAEDIDELAFVRLAGVTHSDLIEGDGDVAQRHVTEAVAIGLFAEVLNGEPGALDAALVSVADASVVVIR